MNLHDKGRRLFALAACMGAVAALLGTAGSAAASVTCGAPGYASGATLELIAQTQVWLTSGGWGAHSSCSVAPTSSTITYTKTSSGNGLEELGNTSGHFEPEKDPTAFHSGAAIKDAAGQVLDWYTGTDTAPTPRELGEAALAAGTLHSQKAEITIPVLQAPEAVLLSLPTGCKLEAGSHVDLNNTTLPQLFEGSNAPSGEDPGGIHAQGGYAIATWGALFTQLGYSEITSGTPTAGEFLDEGGEHGCGQALLPQVYSIVSGTAYGFKNYLAQIDPAGWEGDAGDAPTWPSSADVQSDGGVLNSSNGNEVKNTATYSGSVGFANTADAASSSNGGFTNAATASAFGGSSSHQILWVELQNNGLEASGETYVDPVIPSTSIGDCETTRILPTEEGFPYSYTDSWYGLLASDPNISADASPTDYPLCVLAYDLVFHHYSNKHLFGATEAAHEVANTVHDLFAYITGEGQSEIESHDFTRFPTGLQSHVNNAVTPGIGY